MRYNLILMFILYQNGNRDIAIVAPSEKCKLRKTNTEHTSISYDGMSVSMIDICISLCDPLTSLIKSVFIYTRTQCMFTQCSQCELYSYFVLSSRTKTLISLYDLCDIAHGCPWYNSPRIHLPQWNLDLRTPV